MSLLTLIQRTCKRVGLSAPNTAANSTDENIIRMIELANEEGEELAQYSWQVLTNESTFNSAATESQGAMTTLAGASFGWMKNDTIWNRSQNRRWCPVDEVQWQQMKASGITGPDVYFRIRGGNLIATPTPTAGHTIAFEWVSKNWCQSSGGTGQAAWAADTDTGKLDETLMRMGLIWRWKHAQGLEYAEDFDKYEKRKADAMARDGAKRRIHMNERSAGRLIGRGNVSEGSWSL